MGDARKAVLGVGIGLFEHDAGDAAAQRMEKIILYVIEHRLDIARLRALQKLLHDRRFRAQRAQGHNVDVGKHGVAGRLQDGDRVTRRCTVERIEHAAAAADDRHERDLAAGVRRNKHTHSAGEHEKQAVFFRHGKNHVVPRAVRADDRIQAQHLLLRARQRIPERQAHRKVIGTFVFIRAAHLRRFGMIC